MSDFPEKLRHFEGLFRPEDYDSPAATQPESTLFLEQALPPESWVARARRLGHRALIKTLHSRRTRSYGLGFGLGSTAIATGIAVAFFTPNNNTETAQQPPEPPQKLIIMPASPDKSGVHTTKPDKVVPVAKPSDIPPSLWPTTVLQEPAPATQPSASSKPSSSISKTAQPVKPDPIWSTMLPTASQSSASPEATTDTPPTDGPTLSPEATDTASTEAWPETPPISLSPSPGD